MSKGDKANPWIVTIMGGIIVGALLLFLEYRTEIFTNYSNSSGQNVEPTLPSNVSPASPPVQENDTGASRLVIVHEEVIGKYVYRKWEVEGDNVRYDSTYPGEYLTLSLINEPSVNIEVFWGFAVKADLLTGRDITGEGNPDLIIETFSGGAHCCFQYFVLDLSEFYITRYLQTQASNCPGEFKDLDYDGSYEFITCDDILAYTYCSFVATPLPPVILKYRKGIGYAPATPNFKNDFDMASRILADTSRAEQAQAQFIEPYDVDPTSRNEYFLCPAIQVALDYLYTGNTEKAEQEFYRFYIFPDGSEIWRMVTQVVTRSSLYTSYEWPVN